MDGVKRELAERMRIETACDVSAFGTKAAVAVPPAEGRANKIIDQAFAFAFLE